MVKLMFIFSGTAKSVLTSTNKEYTSYFNRPPTVYRTNIQRPLETPLGATPAITLPSSYRALRGHFFVRARRPLTRSRFTGSARARSVLSIDVFFRGGRRDVAASTGLPLELHRSCPPASVAAQNVRRQNAAATGHHLEEHRRLLGDGWRPSLALFLHVGGPFPPVGGLCRRYQSSDRKRRRSTVRPRCGDERTVAGGETVAD